MQELIDEELLIIEQQLIKRTLMILKNERNFTQLLCISAVDNENGNFSLIYILRSMELNKKLIIKSNILKHDAIQSVIKIFPNADWYEREIFEMFGIKFLNHPNLKALLTCDDIDDFLRKNS